MLGWIDIETNGLEVTDTVLEAAVVITDDELNELDTLELLRRPAGWEWLERIMEQPEVLAMHTANGLIHALLAEAPSSLVAFDNRLASWLGSNHGNQTLTEGHSLVLAGSSVHFDRKMLAEHAPRSSEWFHYRQVDTSTITELARRWAPPLAELCSSTGKPHRALGDVRRSIDLLRAYREAGFVGSLTRVPV